MKKVWNICGYQPNEQAWTMSIIDNYKERRPQKTTSIVDLDPLLSATMSSTFNSLQRLHKYMRFFNERMIKRTILLLLQEHTKKRGTFRCTRLYCKMYSAGNYKIHDVFMNILDDRWLDMVGDAQQKTCMHTSSPFLNKTDTVPVSYTQVIYPNINHS